MKKSFYDFITYSMYRYAPESFTLGIKGYKPLELSNDERSTLGMALIQFGKEGLLKEVKKLFRSKTSIGENFKVYKTLCLIDNENNSYYVKEFGKIDRYDINTKLKCYKILKKLLKEDGFIIEEVTLDGNFKPVNKKKKFINTQKQIIGISFI